ncbi:MAG: hypothetical protein RSC93_01925 [Erysipelotrichaceae bacterium]
MKIFLATIKSFQDIEIGFTMENTFGSTSDNTSTVTVLTDTTSRMTTDLNEIILEFKEAFRHDLEYDKIIDYCKKYGMYSKHIGHSEIEIIMVDLCKKD